MSDWRHDDLAADLARHLKTPSRLVWEDMQIGPAGSHRPDVFTMEKSYSRPLPTVYECKISVSDFRADITSGKWQKYLDFAGSVTFAVPSGLVTRADIPNGCGFMTRGEDGWCTVKRATRQVSKFSVNNLLKLFIDGYGRELGQMEMTRKANWQAHAELKLRRKFGDEIGNVIRDLNQARNMIKYYEGQQETVRKRGEEAARRIRELQEGEWADLRKVLGVAETAGLWEIQREIRNLRAARSGGDTQELVEALKRVASTANAAIDQHSRMASNPERAA